jgi:hypothetical protein
MSEAQTQADAIRAMSHNTLDDAIAIEVMGFEKRPGGWECSRHGTSLERVIAHWQNVGGRIQISVDPLGYHAVAMRHDRDDWAQAAIKRGTLPRAVCEAILMAQRDVSQDDAA